MRAHRRCASAAADRRVRQLPADAQASAAHTLARSSEGSRGALGPPLQEQRGSGGSGGAHACA